MARVDRNSAAYRSQPRQRTFTVPAGTEIAPGIQTTRDIRHTLTYTLSQMTPGAAQKRARAAALAEAKAAYPQAGNVTGAALQRATGQVQKARGYKPAIRGGRKAKPVGTVRDNYGGKVVYHELGKPKRVYNTVRKEVRRIFNTAPPGSTVAIHGKGLPVNRQDYPVVQWMSTDQVLTPGAFDLLAPNAAAFEQWVGIRVRKSEEWTITVRIPGNDGE